MFPSQALSPLTPFLLQEIYELVSAARKVVMWSSFVLSIRALVRCVRVRGCLRARIGMRAGRLQTHKYIHIWCPLYSLASVTLLLGALCL